MPIIFDTVTGLEPAYLDLQSSDYPFAHTAINTAPARYTGPAVPIKSVYDALTTDFLNLAMQSLTPSGTSLISDHGCRDCSLPVGGYFPGYRPVMILAKWRILCVSLQDFFCPHNQIFWPLARGLSCYPQLQVFNSVIVTDAIFVMNIFTWQKFPT